MWGRVYRRTETDLDGRGRVIHVSTINSRPAEKHYDIIRVQYVTESVLKATLRDLSPKIWISGFATGEHFFKSLHISILVCLPRNFRDLISNSSYWRLQSCRHLDYTKMPRSQDYRETVLPLHRQHTPFQSLWLLVFDILAVAISNLAHHRLCPCISRQSLNGSSHLKDTAYDAIDHELARVGENMQSPVQVSSTLFLVHHDESSKGMRDQQNISKLTPSQPWQSLKIWKVSY